MSLRTRYLSLLVALPLSAVALRAQSMPSISGAKNAATRAAAAASAHTEAMQNDQGTPPSHAPQQTTVSMPARSPSATQAPAKSAAAKPAPASSAVAKPVSAPATSAVSAAPSASAPKGAAAKSVAASTSTPAKSGAAKPAAPGATTAAAQPVNGKGAKGAAPTQAGATSVSERGGKNEVSLIREVYAYAPESRRDPFVSLLMTGELRPMMSDLKLVTVVYDPTGRSVAILRDLSTKEQYRVRVGQALGRMRVASIQPRNVTFTLEELGFSRQETLALNDSTKARSQ